MCLLSEKKMLKRIYILCLALIVGIGAMRGVDFTKESLNYQIVYHWGLIWKHAANATLEIKDVGQKYDARLCARTLSWVDNVYRVRDTLYTTIEKTHFTPIKYVKATHEKKHIGSTFVSPSANTSNSVAL